MKELKAGQIWKHPFLGVMEIKSINAGEVVGVCSGGLTLARKDMNIDRMEAYGWELEKDQCAGKVYKDAKNLKRDFTKNAWLDVLSASAADAGKNLGKSLAEAVHSTPPMFVGRKQGKSFLLETLDKARRYASITKDTYWVSRKGRYIRIVQVTDKIVRLRDAITDEYLGFRALEDFARTYQPRLKAGERWVYNGYTVEVQYSGRHSVSIWNDFLGAKSLLVKEFLARASFVGKGLQLTQQFGRAVRPTKVLIPNKTGATEIAVGQVWSSDTRDIHITSVGGKRVGYKTARGSSGSISIATLLERYAFVEEKPISGSSLFMARDYIKCSQFTLEAPGLRSTFANKEGFIDFCRAMVEAGKCQQST